MRRLASLGIVVLNQEVLDQTRGMGQAADLKPMCIVWPPPGLPVSLRWITKATEKLLSIKIINNVLMRRSIRDVHHDDCEMKANQS